MGLHQTESHLMTDIAEQAPIEGNSETSAESEAPQTLPIFQDSKQAPAEAEQPQVQTYKLTIDGQEQELPRDEVEKSFLMQRDYTRKTQELAEQRKELETAEKLVRMLEADPTKTLKLLQEAYEVDFAGGETEGDDEFVDPEEQRWNEVQEFMARQQQAQLEAEIDAEFSQVAQKYGIENTPERQLELIEFAANNNLPSLEYAHILMSHSSDAAQQQAEAAKAAADQAAQAARAQSKIVEGGHGVQSGVVGTPAKVSTVAEAFKQAKARLAG